MFPRPARLQKQQPSLQAPNPPAIFDQLDRSLVVRLPPTHSQQAPTSPNSRRRNSNTTNSERKWTNGRSRQTAINSPPRNGNATTKQQRQPNNDMIGTVGKQQRTAQPQRRKHETVINSTEQPRAK